MAPSSVTSTSTAHDDPGHYISSSISSLSSQRQQTSWLAKTYKYAAQLYLTRRLPEAFDAIEPAVIPDEFSPAAANSSSDEDGAKKVAPVALSSKVTRVKVWSFYITLLNAIVELGPEEGKLAFGSTRWKIIASKVRTGSVWDEVVRYGYGGSEGQVDGEVVANLATLLLTHMTDQSFNQQKLETFLSASMNPAFDVAAHMETSQNGRPHPRRTDSNAGTSTPRDLNTRLKLLELYTLHVLPRNEEWDYARDFINISEVLDDERREAFVSTLQSLREERSHDAIREAELQKRQEEEAERRQQDEARQRKEVESQERSRQERPKPVRKAPSSNSVGSARPPSANGPPNGRRNAPQSRPSRPVRKPPPPQASLYQRASLVLSSVHAGLLNASTSMQKNPMVALRFLLFLFAFMIAFARRDVRERLKRGFDNAVMKIRQTIGMGTKVSYI